MWKNYSTMWLRNADGANQMTIELWSVFNFFHPEWWGKCFVRGACSQFWALQCGGWQLRSLPRNGQHGVFLWRFSNETAARASSGPRETLNTLSNQCQIQPLGRPWTDWERVNEKTRKCYPKRYSEIVSTVLRVICPVNTPKIWNALQSSSMVNQQLGAHQPFLPSERAYLQAKAEAYSNSSSWDTRRKCYQSWLEWLVLVPFLSLGLTQYRYTMANLHRMQYGRGDPVPSQRTARIKVDLQKLAHFLGFITSPHLWREEFRALFRRDSSRTKRYPYDDSRTYCNAVYPVLHRDQLQGTQSQYTAEDFEGMHCICSEISPGIRLFRSRGNYFTASHQSLLYVGHVTAATGLESLLKRLLTRLVLCSSSLFTGALLPWNRCSKLLDFVRQTKPL